MEQVFRTGLFSCFEAVVAHDHSMDDPQLPVCLAQMLRTVMMAHVPGHLLRPCLILREKMQMGVNDLHNGSLLLQGTLQPWQPGFYYSTVPAIGASAAKKAAQRLLF